MDSLADFLFEAGMLCKTPRTGYQFLGSGKESVAEHVLRTIYVGYVLCRMDSTLDEPTVIKICMLHDLPEARTGDMNYVNKKYVTLDEEKAISELTAAVPFGEDIRQAVDEFNEKLTKEALAARDADQIALLLVLKECLDLGNRYAEEWIHFAMQRLSTQAGRELARRIIETDSSSWWFKEKNDWWVNGNSR